MTLSEGSNKTVLKPLGSCPLQVVVTNALQVADILSFVIDFLGQCEIWQTSFSVSEEFLRRLFVLRNRGKIFASSLIIDHKASAKIMKLWQFIRNSYDNAFMADNHSKVLLARSERGAVAVVTSQNLTRGNRFESTLITTEREVFDSLLRDFYNISQNYSINLDDLLSEAD